MVTHWFLCVLKERSFQPEAVISCQFTFCLLREGKVSYPVVAWKASQFEKLFGSQTFCHVKQAPGKVEVMFIHIQSGREFFFFFLPPAAILCIDHAKLR